MAQTKRKKESERKRQALLDQAYLLFGELGYKDLSMDQLAREAGVSKGLIFKFYGSKKSLFEQVINAVLDRVIAYTADRQKPNATALESLETTFLSGFQFVKDHPEMLKLFSQQSSQIVPETLAAHKVYWVQTFTDLLSLCKEEGSLAKHVDIPSTGEVIYHLHKVLIEELFIHDNTNAVTDEMLDATICMIVSGVGRSE